LIETGALESVFIGKPIVDLLNWLITKDVKGQHPTRIGEHANYLDGLRVTYRQRRPQRARPFVSPPGQNSTKEKKKKSERPIDSHSPTPTVDSAYYRHNLRYEVALRSQDSYRLEVGRKSVEVYLGNHYRQYPTRRIVPFVLGDPKLRQRVTAFGDRFTAY
jgi:hypothetical protein